MAALCASRWSAIGTIESRRKTFPKKERLKVRCASRWSAVGFRNRTTKKGLTRAGLLMEVADDSLGGAGGGISQSPFWGLRRRNEVWAGYKLRPMANLELVALVVRDYDPAIRFFVDVLQFELVEDTPSLTNDGRPKRWVVVRPFE